jgi:hypothetical protein
MGGGNPAGRAGATGPVQPVRRREPASRAASGAGEPRASGAPGPGPSRAFGTARNTAGAGSALPLPSLRRAHDGAAARAHCPPPLFGVGDRPGPLPARATRPFDRGDAPAGLHLAPGLRDGPLDDAVGMGRRDRARPAVPSCSPGAPNGVAPESGVAHGSHAVRRRVVQRWDRGAGVRGSRARCMRKRAGRPRPSRAPPSCVVSTLGWARASPSARCTAQREGGNDVVPDPQRSRRGGRAVSQ